MASFANGAEYAYIRQILNASGMRKNNYEATRWPLPSDDISMGYEVGSRWTFGGVEHVCMANTLGAATWNPLSDYDLTNINSPDVLSAGIIDRNQWSKKHWTSGDVLTAATRSLADHPFELVTTEGSDFGIRLLPANWVMSKRLNNKAPHTDLLFKVRVNSTAPGSLSAHVRNIKYGEAIRIDTDILTIPGTGRQTVFGMISAALMDYRTLIRVGFQNTSDSATVVVEEFEVIEVAEWLNIWDFDPPAGPLDAQPIIQEAIRLSKKMTAPKIDFGGGTFDVHAAIENDVYASRWQRGTFRPRGTRAAWAGGTTDFDSTRPRQKGVIRAMEDQQGYKNIRITNPVGYIAEQVVTANSVYTEGRCLANGFEDATRAADGTHATFITYDECGVDEFDDYGVRYSSEDGNGFNVFRCNIRKRMTSNDNADYHRGYCVVLDSGDGRVQDCNLFGGEYQIYQMSGGTIEITGNHPWRGPAYYMRSYFGPAGVPIRTGIQIRSAAQIISFDAGQVAVARDETNWEVVVTPIADILQANAVQVRIRRDEMLALLRGFGSQWENNYFDGGAIRITRGTGHKFGDSNMGLIGAMSNPISMFEWMPQTPSTIPPLELNAIERNFGKRCIYYPNLATGHATPTVPLAVLEEWEGRIAPGSHKIGTYANNRNVLDLYSMGAQAVLNLTHNANAVGAASTGIIVGSFGDPNGNVQGNLGQIYLSTASGQDSRIWEKISGAGTTGNWRRLRDTAAGTWTPELTFGGASTGITYNNRTARWRYVGGLVYLEFLLNLSSKGSAVGAAEVSLPTGLPNAFAFPTSGGQWQVASATNMAGLTCPIGRFNSATLVGLTQVAAGGTVALDNTNFLNTTTLVMTGIVSP